ncbi:hypothetical protein [Pyxidicoccus xibeiensis]|uniref:hypothetical protein n=1 Tax=Pyxidicoccus xibeiensis TaxID=2906759 RepID=UPI0020A795AC|nr:hypothetical protein [Pyxidicoccus xibeiensis]MCP3141609.1 hypothetical protein [Pyxidicoccus xibeiensis]
MSAIKIKGAKVAKLAAGAVPGSERPENKDDKADQQSGTRWMELRYLHADGTGVPNACYVVKSQQTGSVLSQGTLDGNGFRRIDGLPFSEVAVTYWFHDDPTALTIKRKPKPNTNPQPFLVRQVVEAQLHSLAKQATEAWDWTWGVLQGGFNKDASVSQIIADTVISLIPVVDQVADVRDLVAALFDLKHFYARVSWQRLPDEEFWLWMGVVLTLVGCIPELGSAIKGVFRVLLRAFRDASAKVNPRQVLDQLLSVLNYFGKGNGYRWLRALLGQLEQHARWALQKLRGVLGAIESALRKLPDLVRATRQYFLSLLNTLKSRADAMVQRVIAWFKDKLQRVMGQPPVQRKGTTNAPNTTQQQAQRPPGWFGATRKRYDELSQDPAHNGKISPKSRNEARVGMKLEQDGKLAGPIKRDPSGGAEFIDAKGTKWDVKSFDSRWPERKGGFSLTRDVQKIEQELLSGENVILDTQNLTLQHKSQLQQAIQSKGWGGRIQWFP